MQITMVMLRLEYNNNNNNNNEEDNGKRMIEARAGTDVRSGMTGGSFYTSLASHKQLLSRIFSKCDHFDDQ